MRWMLFLCAMSIGSCVLWPSLPAFALGRWLVAAAAILCLCLPICSKPSIKFLCCILLLLASLLYGLWRAQQLVQSQLPAACSGQAFTVIGRVTGLPKLYEVSAAAFSTRTKQRFALEVETIEWRGDQSLREVCGRLSQLQGRTLLLSWYDQNHTVMPAQRWRLSVVLKRPRGQVNPHGFDYQLWLLRRGYRATGYVSAGEKIAASQGLSIDRLRYNWRRQLQRHSEEAADASGIVAALTIGDKSDLSPLLRQQLRDTGTLHLFAISGLHIGLLALAGFWLGRMLATPIVLVMPPRLRCWWQPIKIAALCSCLFAAAYALCSGLTISTQRALVMVLVYHACSQSRRRVDLFDIWLCTLLLVLLIDPINAADGGFYLSFTAVAILLLGMRGRHLIKPSPAAKIVLWLRPQWLMFVAMAPLSVAWLNGVSLISALANAIAIPLVASSLVPLSLLAFASSFILSTLSELLLQLAFFIADIFSQLLVYLTSFGGDVLWWQQFISWPLGLGMVAIAIALLLPLPGQLRAGIVLLALGFSLSFRGLDPRKLENKITVFDVGQGLAVVVEFEGAVLVYDTGPSFDGGADAASSSLIPYLVAAGINRLDVLIVSHNDDDHAGGVANLLAAVSVQQIIAGEPDKLQGRFESFAKPESGSLLKPSSSVSSGVSSCQQISQPLVFGASGELSFIKASSQSTQVTGNNASCVAQLNLGEVTLILPGDIDQNRELNLHFKVQPSGPYRVLLAPHHGSKSSSSFAFINRIAPHWVVFSAAYQSRYGHPHEDIVARYQQLGVAQFSTAESGALQLYWQGHQTPQWRPWRKFEKRFWYD